MRASAWVLAAALAALAACGERSDGGGKADDGSSVATAPDTVPATPASGAAETAPQRRPGKWRMTTTVTGMQPQHAVVCLAEEDDRSLAEIAEQERLAAASCSDRRVTREGDEIVTHAVCKVEGGTQTIDTRARGDFQKDYWIDSTVTMDPPSPGVGQVRSSIHAVWLGEDC